MRKYRLEESSSEKGFKVMLDKQHEEKSYGRRINIIQTISKDVSAGEGFHIWQYRTQYWFCTSVNIKIDCILKGLFHF